MSDFMKEHLILGTDKRDAEEQRDAWLAQNPAVKVIKIHRVRQEQPSLLALVGRKHVPRVSILLEYEEPDRTRYAVDTERYGALKTLAQIASAQAAHSQAMTAAFAAASLCRSGSRSVAGVLVTWPIVGPVHCCCDADPRLAGVSCLALHIDVGRLRLVNAGRAWRGELYPWNGLLCWRAAAA
jgi:hypothetical protein